MTKRVLLPDESFDDYDSGEKQTVLPKHLQKREVNILIQILDKVKREISGSKPITNYMIHNMIRNHKDFNIFLGIYYQIKSMISANKAEGLNIATVAEDYFRSVYDFYSRFKRKPYLSQFSANTDNLMRFEEWIIRWEERYLEKYWERKDNWGNIESFSNEVKKYSESNDEGLNFQADYEVSEI